MRNACRETAPRDGGRRAFESTARPCEAAMKAEGRVAMDRRGRMGRGVGRVVWCFWLSCAAGSRLVARRSSLVTRHLSACPLAGCRLSSADSVADGGCRRNCSAARPPRHCGQIPHRAGQERRVDRRAATKNRGSQAQVPRGRRRTSNARHRARGVSARRREPRARRQEPGAQRPGVGTSAAILQACRAGSVCPSTPSPESDS